jgi:hypothetical protein
VARSCGSIHVYRQAAAWRWQIRLGIFIAPPALAAARHALRCWRRACAMAKTAAALHEIPSRLDGCGGETLCENGGAANRGAEAAVGKLVFSRGA